MAIAEGAIDEQAKALMQESKDEITKLREELNTAISEKMEMNSKQEEAEAIIKESKDEIIKLKVANYIHEKYSDLSAAKRTRIIALIPESVKLEGEDKINEEVDFIIKNIIGESAESMGNDKPLGQEKTPIQGELEKKCKCPSCGKVIDVADTNVSCSTIKCPDCTDTYLTDCDSCSENKKNEALPYNKNNELNESYVAKAASMFAQLID